MSIGAVLFAVITFLWVYFLWSRRKFYALRLKMSGPIGLPFIGYLHKLANVEEILYNLPKIASQHNCKTYFFWFGPYPVVYTMDPEIAQIVLNSPDCINKSVIYDVLIDMLGNGVLILKSPTWNKHRKLLNPAFSHKVILEFIPTFNKHSRELCNQLDKHVNCGEVDVKDFLLNLALKSSVASTMGLHFKEGSDMTFMRHFERGLEISVDRLVKPWLRNSTIFSLSSQYKAFKESNTFVTNFVNKLVMEKVKIFEQHGLKENSNKSNPTEASVDIEKTKHLFIDQAIKIHQKKEFTFDDIITESKIMVFAAFETTATTLFSTLMCLAMHPQYQERVFEEIVTVFPQEEFDVKYEDLKDLVYLDMCINETLRVVATVPAVARECSKDLLLPNNVVVPKGTQMFIDVLSIHRDEDTWGPDAKSFNPDNFLPANLADHHKYSFIPYLKGPRTCIGWQYAGMIMKVVLVQVLRKYHFSTKFHFEDLKFVENITLKYQKLPLLEIQRR